MAIRTLLQKFLHRLKNPILREGEARRVVFFYPGEEGTYLDQCRVKIFTNGVVEVSSKQENTMCHIQNCEILWSYKIEGEEREAKVRLLRSKQLASPDKIITPTQINTPDEP